MSQSARSIIRTLPKLHMGNSDLKDDSGFCCAGSGSDKQGAQTQVRKSDSTTSGAEGGWGEGGITAARKGEEERECLDSQGAQHPPHQAALCITRLPLTWQQAGSQVSAGTACGHCLTAARNSHETDWSREGVGEVSTRPWPPLP